MFHRYFSEKQYCGIVFPFGFSSVYKESESELYLYYSFRKGNSMPSSIGVAFSKDGVRFTNLSISVLVHQKQFKLFHIATPAVTKINSLYIMVFSGRTGKFDPLSIYLAISKQPQGPFIIIGRLLKPNIIRESFWVDNGPGIVHLGKRKLLIYYSNTMKTPFDFIRGYIKRKIRCLEITIDSINPFSFRTRRLYVLNNLNGKRGEWNESLFCPGYIEYKGRHYLFPTAGVYSIRPFPSQSIGLFESSNPLFLECTSKMQLIDGGLERKKIYPRCKGEIGLDTPSPVIINNDLFLYFSITDRTEGRWMTALTIFRR